MLLYTTQENVATETDFVAKLREAARYCKFETLKTSADPEAEVIRL